jgi:hypothetical protein
MHGIPIENGVKLGIGAFSRDNALNLSEWIDWHA